MVLDGKYVYCPGSGRQVDIDLEYYPYASSQETEARWAGVAKRMTMNSTAAEGTAKLVHTLVAIGIARMPYYRVCP